MKRRTTRKKQEDIQKRKKGYLTDMIMGIVLVFVFTILTVVSLYRYNEKPLTYSDVVYKEFTFESFETRNTGKSAYYHHIYVKEEEYPLIIDSITSSYDIRQKLYDINEGDIISCYVLINSDTIVEMKSRELIFTLDFYNKTRKHDGLIGLIIMPILTTASIIFTLVFSKKYKKLKNANQ